MRKCCIVLLLLALVVTACDDKKRYDVFRHAPIDGWDRNDTLVFDIPTFDESGTFDVLVHLRITNAFPLQNLVLNTKIETYPTHKMLTDTLHCALFNQNGRAIEQGVGFAQYTFPLKSLTIAQGDSLRIGVWHPMKRAVLQGVSDVGIEIRKR